MSLLCLCLCIERERERGERFCRATTTGWNRRGKLTKACERHSFFFFFFKFCFSFVFSKWCFRLAKMPLVR